MNKDEILNEIIELVIEEAFIVNKGCRESEFITINEDGKRKVIEACKGYRIEKHRKFN